MKKPTKIIATFAILAVLIGATSASVSALTLKQRDEAARAKYQSARQQYLKEVNFYKNARQNFLNARNKYRQFKNVENKKAFEDAARNYLERVVKSLIRRLEAIKNWVSNRRALPESERQAIAAEIDKDIAWLNERLPKIQTADPAAIKEEAKTIRGYWKTHRVRVKRIIGEIWAARINFVIAKAEGFSERIRTKIEDLKSAGKDTGQLEAWLDDFNQKLALAKEKYEAAKAKFKEIRGEPGFDPMTEFSQAHRLFREGHQFITEANHYIRQAHAQLVRIVKEMKKMAAEKAAETEATSTQQ